MNTSGTLVTTMPQSRGGVHVHRVRADAAEADRHALLQALDDGTADAAAAGDERVRFRTNRGDELRLGLRRHFDDARADGVQRFALYCVERVRQIVGDATLRLHHHLVFRFGHFSIIPSWLVGNFSGTLQARRR